MDQLAVAGKSVQLGQYLLDPSITSGGRCIWITSIYEHMPMLEEEGSGLYFSMGFIQCAFYLYRNPCSFVSRVTSWHTPCFVRASRASSNGPPAASLLAT